MPDIDAASDPGSSGNGEKKSSRARTVHKAEMKAEGNCLSSDDVFVPEANGISGYIYRNGQHNIHCEETAKM